MVRVAPGTAEQIEVRSFTSNARVCKLSYALSGCCGAGDPRWTATSALATGCSAFGGITGYATLVVLARVSHCAAMAAWTQSGYQGSDLVPVRQPVDLEKIREEQGLDPQMVRHTSAAAVTH